MTEWQSLVLSSNEITLPLDGTGLSLCRNDKQTHSIFYKP